MTVYFTDSQIIEKPKYRWGCIFSTILYILSVGYVGWLLLMIVISWNWPPEETEETIEIHSFVPGEPSIIMEEPTITIGGGMENLEYPSRYWQIWIPEQKGGSDTWTNEYRFHITPEGKIEPWKDPTP